MRIHEPNRWNWSTKADKWVFVELKGGKRKYYYQENPPQEFLDLVNRVKEINEKMIDTADLEENEELYEELMEISKKMQIMKKGST